MALTDPFPASFLLASMKAIGRQTLNFLNRI